MAIINDKAVLEFEGNSSKAVKEVAKLDKAVKSNTGSVSVNAAAVNEAIKLDKQFAGSISKLSGELTKLNADYVKHEASLKSANQAYKEGESSVASLSEANTRAATRLNELNLANEKNIGSMQRGFAVTNKGVTAIDDLTVAQASYLMKLEGSVGALEESTTAVARLTQSQGKLTAEMKTVEKQLGVATALYGENSQEVQELKAKMSGLTNAYDDNKATLTGWTIEMEQQRKVVDETLSSHSHLTKNLGVSNRAFVDAAKSVVKYSGSIAANNSLIDDASNKANKLAFETAQAKTQHDQIGQSIKKEEAALKSLNKSITETDAEMAGFVQAQKDLEGVIDQGTKAVIRNSSALTRLVSTVAKVTPSMAKMGGAVKNATKDFNIMDTKVGQVENALKDYQTVLKVTETAAKGFNIAVQKSGAALGTTTAALNKGVQATNKFLQSIAKTTAGIIDETTAVGRAITAWKKFTSGVRESTAAHNKETQAMNEARLAKVKATQATINLKLEQKELAVATKKAAAAAKKETIELKKETAALKEATAASNKHNSSLLRNTGIALASGTAIFGVTKRLTQYTDACNRAAVQFEAAFSDTEAVTADLKAFGSQLGISTNQMKAAASAAQLQAENYGFAAQEAENFAIVQAKMVALLSVTNTSMKSFAETAGIVQSAIRGEAEAAEALNVSLGASAMQEYIDIHGEMLGITEDSWAALSAEEQMLARMSSLFDQLAAQMGVTIPVVTDMASATEALNLMLASQLENMPPLTQASVELKNTFNELKEVIKPLIDVLALMGAIIATLLLVPIAALVTLIGDLIGAFTETETAAEALDVILNILAETWNKIKIIIYNVMAALSLLVRAIVELAEAIAAVIDPYMDELVKILLLVAAGVLLVNAPIIAAVGLFFILAAVLGEDLIPVLAKVAKLVTALAIAYIAYNAIMFVVNVVSLIYGKIQEIQVKLLERKAEKLERERLALEESSKATDEKSKKDQGLNRLLGLQVKLYTIIGAVILAVAVAIMALIGEPGEGLERLLTILSNILTPLIELFMGLVETLINLAKLILTFIIPPLAIMAAIIMNTLGPIIEKLTSLIQPLVEVFQALMDILTPIIGVMIAIGGIILGLLIIPFKILAELLGGIVMAVLEVFERILLAIVEPLEKIAAVLTEKIIPLLKRIAEIILPPLIIILGAIYIIIQKIVDIIQRLWDKIMAIIEPILAWLDTLTPLQTILDLIRIVLEKIVNIIQRVIDIIQRFIDAIQRLLAPLKKAWEALDPIERIVSAISSAMETLIGWIKEVISWFEELYERITSLFEGGIELGGGLNFGGDEAAAEAQSFMNSMNKLMGTGQFGIGFNANSLPNMLSAGLYSPNQSTFTDTASGITTPIGGNETIIINYNGVQKTAYEAQREARRLRQRRALENKYKK